MELVQPAWRAQGRAAGASGDCDVDGSRDGIDQAVTGKRGLQAEGGERDPFGNFDKVVVGGWGVSPTVDATA